ncbi:MAG: DUF2721 domain-containing protein [Planctomycetes bacterium]|nr:DUF2721 domain-containing protein [Planctomycetota bacterium]
MQFSILLAEIGVSKDGAQAIQLALAPVFLLTGIAGILNVLTGRLSRIIDRGRYLTESPRESLALSPRDCADELRILERRRHLASVAITACTLAALLVCMVVVLIFVEVFFSLPLKWLEGVVFTGSTVALVVGLTYFLREVHFATRNVRIKLKTDTTKPCDSKPASP